MGIILFHLPASKHVMKMVTCPQLRDKVVKTEYSCIQDYIIVQHATQCSTPNCLLLCVCVCVHVHTLQN